MDSSKNTKMIISDKSWSNLPGDLLAMIAEFLVSYYDVVRFRAVCRSWRSSTPPPRRFPPVPVELRFLTPHHRNVALYVTQRSVFRLEAVGLDGGSTNNAWLMKVEEETEAGLVRIINPFTRLPIINLPDTFPKQLNTLNFRITQVATSYSIDEEVFYYSSDMGSDEEDEEEIDGDERILHCKLAFATPSQNINEQIVFSIAGGELHSLKVSNRKWKKIDRGPDDYRDLIYYKGSICGVMQNGLGWMSNNISSNIHQILPQHPTFCGERYLVESCDHLYLVSRDYTQCMDHIFYDPDTQFYVRRLNAPADLPIRFKVFKLLNGEVRRSSSPKYRWEEVSDLGGRIFVVGRDCSYSVSAEDFDGAKGNCIYFVDELEDGYDYEDDLVDNTKIFVYNFEDGSGGPLQSFPDYPNIFWPPPAWLLLPPPAN